MLLCNLKEFLSVLFKRPCVITMFIIKGDYLHLGGGRATYFDMIL